MSKDVFGCCSLGALQCTGPAVSHRSALRLRLRNLGLYRYLGVTVKTRDKFAVVRRGFLEKEGERPSSSREETPSIYLKLASSAMPQQPPVPSPHSSLGTLKATAAHSWGLAFTAF